MHSSPYTSGHHVANPWRSIRDAEGVRWSQDLPLAWAELVVRPIRFDVFYEYEMAADRIVGYDENEAPCYCAFRYVLTGLRPGDDDVLYEAPVYAESLTAWRLRDERWLNFRSVIRNHELGAVQNFFTLSESMPR